MNNLSKNCDYLHILVVWLQRRGLGRSRTPDRWRQCDSCTDRWQRHSWSQTSQWRSSYTAGTLLSPLADSDSPNTTTTMMLTSTSFPQTTNYMKSTAILFQDCWNKMLTILKQCLLNTKWKVEWAIFNLWQLLCGF